MKNLEIAKQNTKICEEYLREGSKIPPSIMAMMLMTERMGVIGYNQQFLKFTVAEDEWSDGEIPFIAAGMLLALRHMVKRFKSDKILYNKYKMLKDMVKNSITIVEEGDDADSEGD